MTLEEAKQIIENCCEDYHDFDARPFTIDGHYTLNEMEALLILARDAAAAKEVTT